MNIKIMIAALALAVSAVSAQAQFAWVGKGAPPPPCYPNTVALDQAGGNLYTCAAGQWTTISGGGGGGGSFNLTATATPVAAGSPATASVSGTFPNFSLSLGLPSGANGASPNLTMGTVTTLAAGATATATITGTFPNLTLNLGIPQGAAGSGGSQSDSTKNAAYVYQAGSGGNSTKPAPTAGEDIFAYDSTLNIVQRSINGGAYFTPVNTIAAGNNITASLNSNTGVVTLSASGGGGGSYNQPFNLLTLYDAGAHASPYQMNLSAAVSDQGYSSTTQTPFMVPVGCKLSAFDLYVTSPGGTASGATTFFVGDLVNSNGSVSQFNYVFNNTSGGAQASTTATMTNGQLYSHVVLSSPYTVQYGGLIAQINLPGDDGANTSARLVGVCQ